MSMVWPTLGSRTAKDQIRYNVDRAYMPLTEKETALPRYHHNAGRDDSK